MQNGAEFTKAQLDALDNSQLLTMSRDEARAYVDGDPTLTEELETAMDYAQGAVQNGGVTFVVIRIEG